MGVVVPGKLAVSWIGMFALTVITELNGTEAMRPLGAVAVEMPVSGGGRLPLPAEPTTAPPSKTPFDAFTTAGDKLPPPVYGLTSYCQSRDIFHSARYHCGFAAVPSFAMTSLSGSPLGPIMFGLATVFAKAIVVVLAGIMNEVLDGTPVTLKSDTPVYAS